MDRLGLSQPLSDAIDAMAWMRWHDDSVNPPVFRQVASTLASLVCADERES